MLFIELRYEIFERFNREDFPCGLEIVCLDITQPMLSIHSRNEEEKRSTEKNGLFGECFRISNTNQILAIHLNREGLYVPKTGILKVFSL